MKERATSETKDVDSDDESEPKKKRKDEEELLAVGALESDSMKVWIRYCSMFYSLLGICPFNVQFVKLLSCFGCEMDLCVHRKYVK